MDIQSKFEVQYENFITKLDTVAEIVTDVQNRIWNLKRPTTSTACWTRQRSVPCFIPWGQFGTLSSGRTTKPMKFWTSITRVGRRWRMFEEMLGNLEMRILERVDRYLNDRQEQAPKVLGLISQSDLEKDLGISYPTVIRWEKLGLKRYLPPLEDTRTVFYKISDVLKFLGVEDGDD